MCIRDRYIDKLKEKGKIEEEVIIQTGYSTYQPQYCEWKKLYHILSRIHIKGCV